MVFETMRVFNAYFEDYELCSATVLQGCDAISQVECAFVFAAVSTIIRVNLTGAGEAEFRWLTIVLDELGTDVLTGQH